MAHKDKKTFLIPTWITPLLESEAAKYDGPGVVTAAALHHFCTLDADGKAEILKRFREAEIDHAYNDDAPRGADAAATAKVKKFFKKVKKAAAKDKKGSKTPQRA